MSKFFSKDANHNSTIKFLASCFVWAHDGAAIGNGFTDLIVYDMTGKAEMGFLELKTDNKKADFKRTQIEFMSKCPAPIGFAKTNEQALAFAKDPQKFGLTKYQKERLLALLLRDQRKKFPVTEIEKLLEKRF